MPSSVTLTVTAPSHPASSAGVQGAGHARNNAPTPAVRTHIPSAGRWQGDGTSHSSPVTKSVIDAVQSYGTEA